MPKHKSSDYKLAAVNYYLHQNKNQVKTCRIFGCSPRSLMRWVNRYLDTGSVKKKTRYPISYKVTQEQVDYILTIIKSNKTITMNEMLDKLRNRFPNINLTSRHISNILRDNNISLKLTRIRHEPKFRYGKPIDIKKNIRLFYDKVKGYHLDDIICIDETSIKSLHKRNFCYSEKGKRCIIKNHSQEVFKKYTGIFAISTKGVLGWTLYEKGGINSNRLYEFLEKFITNKYSNKLIIMDNASSHRNQMIKDLVNENNTLLYSVPYQHFTNAIENWFSLLKSRLQKKSGLTHKDLEKNINDAIRDISISKFINIFKGSYSRTMEYKPKRIYKIKKNYL